MPWMEVAINQNYLILTLVYCRCDRGSFVMSNVESTTSSMIELLKPEIITRAMLLFNPATGGIWELSVQNGKIVIDVPHFSFQIASNSTSKFRPVNPLINLEFEFEKQQQRQPLLMHIYAKGIKRATFKAL